MERFPVAMVTLAQLHCICSSATKNNWLNEEGTTRGGAVRRIQTPLGERERKLGRQEKCWLKDWPHNIELRKKNIYKNSNIQTRIYTSFICPKLPKLTDFLFIFLVLSARASEKPRDLLVAFHLSLLQQHRKRSYRNFWINGCWFLRSNWKQWH